MSEQEQIMSFFSQFEEKTKNLPRDEKLRLRNNIILRDTSVGRSKDYISKKFRISVRQVERILREIYDGVDDWYKSLPRGTLQAIHRANTEEIFDEIAKLKNIRAGIRDTQMQEKATVDIIESWIKYDRMVAEGPALTRQKELVAEMEKKLGIKQG
ncbi:MAG: hypothetical protein WD154_06260 [Nitrosopumilaceae archaeon]